MTLIVAFGNRENLVQISDRRLSTGKSVVSDRANKSFAYRCDTAVALIGFTGLARAPNAQGANHDTHRWLIKALQECSKPESNFGRVTERLRDMATEYFSKNTAIKCLPKESKRLSIILTAYIDAISPPALVSVNISNFETLNGGYKRKAESEFRIRNWSEPERNPRLVNPVFVECAGTITKEEKAHFNPLLELLGKKVAIETVINKAAELFREFSDHPDRSGSIGKDLSIIQIPRGSTESCLWDSSHDSTRIVKGTDFSPTFIWAVQGGRLLSEMW